MTLRIGNVYSGKLIALIAGGSLPLAFAPFNYYVIAILSLAALLWSCRDVQPKQAFIHGYLFGFACFGIGVNWLHISINLFGGVNLAGALFFTYLLVAFLALYPALCVWIAVRFFSAQQFIAFPFLWLLTEWLRGWLLSGFPWLNIGTSQTDSMLSAYVPVIGDYGTSLIVAILATALVLLFKNNLYQRIASVIVALLLLAGGKALSNIDWTAPTGEKLNVALVQGAIPQEIKWQPDQRQPTLELYTELSQTHWSDDLVIWPETAIPSLYHLANDFLARIHAEKHNKETVFMSGIAYQDAQSRDYFNSILIIDNQHRFYHKHKLVPFGEYMPFKSILGRLLKFLRIPMSDFSSGDADLKTMETSKATLGLSICYEDAYGEEIRKSMPAADIFINLSNDAWFGDSLAPHQHMQIARMRAIENGRYLLRATNTGISAVIDNKGKVVARSPQFKPHTLSSRVELFTGITPFSRWGNLPVILFSVALLLLLFFFRKKKANH